MIPDLATLRDRAAGGIKKIIFRVLSLGWNGSHRTWARYEIVSLILAGLATPLVLSVHSIVSIDFATSLIPGWHTTIFPPYFVAGAIYSGFGMVLTLLLITRQTMHLERYITVRHLDAMAKVLLLTGSIVSYAYATEFFSAWYGGNLYERYHFINRATGPYAFGFYLMVLCNALTPQLFWFKRVRTSVADAVRGLDPGQHRHVVRALRHHRGLAPPRLPAVGLGHVLSDHGRHRHPRRQLRSVLHAVPAVHPRSLPMIAMWEIKGVRRPRRAQDRALPTTHDDREEIARA